MENILYEITTYLDISFCVAMLTAHHMTLNFLNFTIFVVGAAPYTYVMLHSTYCQTSQRRRGGVKLHARDPEIHLFPVMHSDSERATSDPSPETLEPGMARHCSFDGAEPCDRCNETEWSGEHLPPCHADIKWYFNHRLGRKRQAISRQIVGQPYKRQRSTLI